MVTVNSEIPDLVEDPTENLESELGISDDIEELESRVADSESGTLAGLVFDLLAIEDLYSRLSSLETIIQEQINSTVEVNLEQPWGINETVQVVVNTERHEVISLVKTCESEIQVIPLHQLSGEVEIVEPDFPY